MTDAPSSRRALGYDAYVECWYVPGETHIVDLIHPDDGLTLHAAEDADAVRARYPSALRLACDDAWQQIDAIALTRYRTDVVEISEERFLDALNVLPPVGWTTRCGVESFKISERIWGNVTDIFARCSSRYFKLSDDMRLSADVIGARVLEFIAAHPTSTQASEPQRPETCVAHESTAIASPKPEGTP